MGTRLEQQPQAQELDQQQQLQLQQQLQQQKELQAITDNFLQQLSTGFVQEKRQFTEVARENLRRNVGLLRDATEAGEFTDVTHSAARGVSHIYHEYENNWEEAESLLSELGYPGNGGL